MEPNSSNRRKKKQRKRTIPNESGEELSQRRRREAIQRMKLIDEDLKSKSLVRVQIPKDGACLFRCVAALLFGSQSFHIKVRNECVDYLEKNKDYYTNFVEGEWRMFVTKMRKPDEWGDQITIHAMSEMYKVNFVIYQFPAEKNLIPESSQYNKTILLNFSNGNHYDIVYERAYFNALTMSQDVLVNDIFSSAVGIKKQKKRKGVHVYENIEYKVWEEEAHKAALRVASLEKASYAHIAKGSKNNKKAGLKTHDKNGNPLTAVEVQQEIEKMLNPVHMDEQFPSLPGIQAAPRKVSHNLQPFACLMPESESDDVLSFGPSQTNETNKGKSIRIEDSCSWKDDLDDDSVFFGLFPGKPISEVVVQQQALPVEKKRQEAVPENNKGPTKSVQGLPCVAGKEKTQNGFNFAQIDIDDDDEIQFGSFNSPPKKTTPKPPVEEDVTPKVEKELNEEPAPVPNVEVKQESSMEVEKANDRAPKKVHGNNGKNVAPQQRVRNGSNPNMRMPPQQQHYRNGGHVNGNNMPGAPPVHRNNEEMMKYQQNRYPYPQQHPQYHNQQYNRQQYYPNYGVPHGVPQQHHPNAPYQQYYPPYYPQQQFFHGGYPQNMPDNKQPPRQYSYPPEQYQQRYYGGPYEGQQQFHPPPPQQQGGYGYRQSSPHPNNVKHAPKANITRGNRNNTKR